MKIVYFIIMGTLAINKRAHFDYEFLETYEAGLALLGTEVKSVKAGNISLKGSFIIIHDDQAYLTNSVVPPWQAANAPSDYDPNRSRKILLKKAELKHLTGNRQKGLTIVPVRVYTKRSLVKIQIALARGKHRFDKKKEKKEKDIFRETQRFLRGKE